MVNFMKLAVTAAVAGTLAAPLFAQDTVMDSATLTCSQYSALSANDQMRVAIAFQAPEPAAVTLTVPSDPGAGALVTPEVQPNDNTGGVAAAPGSAAVTLPAGDAEPVTVEGETMANDNTGGADAPENMMEIMSKTAIECGKNPDMLAIDAMKSVM
ncbi:hypothetical protein RNZ50_15310 [Paracoccaceae bacterium Fryx2]|nr:hypothetical protein [Paracoccaceae bacterium Fryx2]